MQAHPKVQLMRNLSSGEFSKSLANKREAVGTYFASDFIDQWPYYRDPMFQLIALCREAVYG